MGPTARTPLRVYGMWLAGMWLAIIAVSVVPAAAAAQQAARTSGGAQDQEAAASEKKPENKTQITDTVQPGQASENGKTSAAKGSAHDQKVKAADEAGSTANPKKNVNQGKSKATESQESATKTAAASPTAIHRAAAQILDSLDAALGVAQKPGTLNPGSPAGKQANEITARRNELRQKAKVATDDNAWSDVAGGAAAALADTVKLTGENPASPAPEPHQPGSASLSSTLLLYVAGLSLAFSVLGLGCGWLLTRREINKALIEAGLV